METILIGLVCSLPILALILGLYTLKDDRKRRDDQHKRDMLDRDLQRWLLMHRLQYDERGNPVIHLADLEQNLHPGFGNPAEVKLMINNSMTREIKAKRPLPEVRDWHKNKGSSELEPGSEPELEPELPEPAEPKQLPEPLYELSDDEKKRIIRQAKTDGLNQREAVFLVTGKRKGGSPEWRRWADIFNSIEI